MPRVSEEFANATLVASSFMAIHLFRLLIEKGVLGVEDGRAVLKMVRNDLALASRHNHLDPTLFEAEHLISKMYASLQNEADPKPAAAPAVSQSRR